MAITEKAIYYTGLNHLKLPGISGDISLIQIDAHGGGGGGTTPVGLLPGGYGGSGGYIGAMFGVPGGSELHIGVGNGGGNGTISGNVFNGGVINGWGNESFYTTATGGSGGEGNSYNGSVQGGGGGALTTVGIVASNSIYTKEHLSYADAWPRDPNPTIPVTSNNFTPLMWAGGGGGGPGANVLNNSAPGARGLDCMTNVIHGRAYYYYYNTTNGGDMVNRAQQAAYLGGSGYGGGGTGGAADSIYGEFTSYEYASAYIRNGGGRLYYYGQTSAYGGQGGKSGLNGYYTSTADWYETPELYPGIAWRGTTKALASTNVPNGTTGLTWRNENLGMDGTKNVVIGLSQYGGPGDPITGAGNGRVTVRYTRTEGAPNEIDTFLNEYDAELNTYYTTRNSVTILGINKAVSATVVGDDARLIVNGNLVVVGKTAQVTNGAVIKLYVLSPNTYNTERTTYLRVGDVGSQVESRYIIRTKDRQPDIVNPWDFVDVTNALPNTVISSDSVQITGLVNGSARVTISASTISGVPIASGDLSLYIANIKKEGNTGIIYNGDYIQIKVKSSSTPGDKITVLITIGDSPVVDWLVTTTSTIDTAPEYYNFTNLTDVVGGTTVESNIVQITGINYSANITTSNDENIPVYVSVNGGDWKNPAAETVTIENQQSLQLKITAPNQPSTTVRSTIVVGTNQYGYLADEWKITTSLAGDTIPDPFVFVDRPNQKATTLVYSNQIIIRGITSPSSLSITKPSDFTGSQAQFSINNGTDWYDITGLTHPAPPAPSSISNNNPLMLRLRTGGYGSNSANINVNIGGVTDQWSVTTLPEPPVTDQASTWYSSLGKADGYSIGTVISVFRDSSGSFGVLDGSPESRYPGFIECDGRTLNVSDYPDLFNVIGNTYGGVGNKSDESPYVYSGDFNLPDYRNRKLYGTGRVDGNVSSSVSVPTFIGPDGTDAGSSTTVGSQGGFWYIDKIDPRGPYPREQLFEDEITSEFFRIGTIKTNGYQNVTGDTLFTIIGDCTAPVGPLKETIVKTPEHFHELVSSSLSETKNGLIAWGSPGVLPLQGARTLGQSGVGAYYPGAPSPPAQGIGSNTWNASVTYNNYWASAVSNNIPLNNSNNSDAPGKVTTGGSIRLGAIDLGDNGTGNVIGYSPGGTLTHSHYISPLPFGGYTYGYGNVNGPGTKYGSISSLQETAEVSFTSSELAIISDPGTFTLSTKKAIVPTAKFRPNITVPLITKYYRAKYVIKAF